jgi:hypothetical protein
MSESKKKSLEEYIVGQHITHAKFGKGEIVSTVPGESIKVKFNKSVKTLLLAYNKTTIVKDE